MPNREEAKKVDQWNIFDHLLDAVFLVDREARLHYTNESFRNLCDASARAAGNREEVSKYIELPEECWGSLKMDDQTATDGVGYREVGFITKSGTMGRAQVMTGALMVPELSNELLFYVILRDVTVEARLHAKYKVQIENNERLIGDLQRSLSETMFLRRLATDLPIYADTGTLLQIVANRLKTELLFRDAHFFYVPETDAQVPEPVGIDKRMGSRLREVVRHFGPALRKPESPNQLVTSIAFRPFGVYWVTYFQPRMERPIVLIASAKQTQEDVDHRTLLEALSGQVSTLLDNRALYFDSISDPITGLFNKRFFNSRFGIECSRSSERRSPLTLMRFRVDQFDQLIETHGQVAGDAVLTTIGQLIKRRIRESDAGAHLGTQEFAVLLPETSPVDAHGVAVSLVSQIAEMTFIVPGGTPPLKVSISCGISGFRWAIDTQKDVFESAGKFLDMASEAGANQIRNPEKPERNIA